MISLTLPSTEILPDKSAVAKYRVVLRDTAHDIFFRFSTSPISTKVDPLLAATLFAAMGAGEDIAVNAPLSSRLIEHSDTLQDILATWNQRLSRVRVNVSPADPARESVAAHPTPRGVACFFSGGVDSFYTALKRDREIDTLIFVHGFDIPLDDTGTRAMVSQELRAAAERLGKRLIVCETNIRTLSDLYARWGHDFHGAALASIALFLAPQLRRAYIPSSYPYADLFPWGSHPLLDYHWSTEDLDLVHDGAEATRMQKMFKLAGSSVALDYLRVCFENRGAYNCGVCGKCLRTLAGLRVAGAADRCKTFARPLDLAALSRVAVTTARGRHFLVDLLDEAKRRGGDPELERALVTALNNRPGRGLRQLAKSVRRQLTGKFRTPAPADSAEPEA